MRLSISSLMILSLLVFLTSGCATIQSKYHPGGPYYYKCWAGSYVPFRPVDEISLEEAKLIESNGYPYYEARFNKDGYIISFKKYIEGKVEWEDKYYYENGIFQRRELEKSDGSKIIGYYDKEGKLLDK